MSLSNLEYPEDAANTPVVVATSLSDDGEALPHNEDSFVHEPLGTIFMGPNPLLEASLSSFDGSAASKVWDEKTEAEYLERVRVRAVSKATDILSEARTEAENIRKLAHEQGYADGLAAASAEVEEFRAELGSGVGAVMEAIEGQSSNIFDSCREDLATLTRLAVEKILAIELSEERVAIIDGLLKQAVEKLENRTFITIKVNPEDESLVADVIASAQLRYPDLKAWQVRTDASITPGGLLLESQDSLIDNRLESRKQIVASVLDALKIESQKL